MNPIQEQLEERARGLFRDGLKAVDVARRIKLPPIRIVALEAEIADETKALQEAAARRAAARGAVQVGPPVADLNPPPAVPEIQKPAEPALSQALSNPQSDPQSPAEPAPTPPPVVPVMPELPVEVALKLEPPAVQTAIQKSDQPGTAPASSPGVPLHEPLSVGAPPAPPVIAPPVAAPPPRAPAAPVLPHRTSSHLRDMLFDEMRGLRDGTTTPQKALAVAKLAAQICQTVELELRVSQFTQGANPTGGRDVRPVVLVEGKAEDGQTC